MTGSEIAYERTIGYTRGRGSVRHIRRRFRGGFQLDGLGLTFGVLL